MLPRPSSLCHSLDLPWCLFWKGNFLEIPLGIEEEDWWKSFGGFLREALAASSGEPEGFFQWEKSLGKFIVRYENGCIPLFCVQREDFGRMRAQQFIRANFVPRNRVSGALLFGRQPLERQFCVCCPEIHTILAQVTHLSSRNTQKKAQKAWRLETLATIWTLNNCPGAHPWATTQSISVENVNSPGYIQSENSSTPSKRKFVREKSREKLPSEIPSQKNRKKCEACAEVFAKNIREENWEKSSSA